jgi:putative SOS response-associated peptidase YedK
MCGRYSSYTPPDAIRRFVGAMNVAPNFEATWNLAPSQAGLVVRRHPETGERRLDALRWGFLPNWAKDPNTAPKPINARAETVASSGMFRAAAAARRCLVPADAFYEWHRTPAGKQPYAFARADGEPMMLAGVWDGWRGPDGQIVRSYAIITCQANATMAPIHGRMPVILERDSWPVWLGEAEGDALGRLSPADDGILKVWSVTQAVNSVRHHGPELLAAAATFSPTF